MKENSTQFYHSTEENSHSLKLHCPSQGTLDRPVTFGMNGGGGQKWFFFCKQLCYTNAETILKVLS